MKTSRHQSLSYNGISLMKGELGGKILNEFVGPRAKTYSYLRNDNNESRKAKD